jgi:hypothetical protein
VKKVKSLCCDFPDRRVLIIADVVLFQPVMTGQIRDSEKVKVERSGGFVDQKVPDLHRYCERRWGETPFMGLSEGENQPIGGKIL